MLNDVIGLFRRRRWVAVAAGGGLLFLVLSWQVLLPRTHSAYQTYQQWQRQARRVRSAENSQGKLTQLAAAHRRLQRRLDSLFVSLPQGDRMSVILGAFQKHAQETGVRLRQVRPGKRKEHPTYTELPLEVALVGDYHAIARFIDRIERSKYLLRIGGAALRSKEMTSDTLQAQIRIDLLTLRAEDASTPEASPAPPSDTTLR